VVRVNVQIAPAGERQIQLPETAQRVQHVVKEANAGRKRRFAAAVEGQREGNVRFAGRAGDDGSAHEDTSLVDLGVRCVRAELSGRAHLARQYGIG